MVSVCITIGSCLSNHWFLSFSALAPVPVSFEVPVRVPDNVPFCVPGNVPVHVIDLIDVHVHVSIPHSQFILFQKGPMPVDYCRQLWDLVCFPKKFWLKISANVSVSEVAERSSLLAEVGIANFFLSPLIANPLICWSPLNANLLIFQK